MKGLPLGLLCLLLNLLLYGQARAHELRPAQLDIEETLPGQYLVQWKVPQQQNQAIPKFHLQISPPCQQQSVSSVKLLQGYAMGSLMLDCNPGTLAGRHLSLPDLSSNLLDTLVHYQPLDGPSQSSLLNYQNTGLDVAEPAAVLGFYRLGIYHILTGIDHLLFVLGLLALVSSLRTLLLTITAFTVAHSITLTAAVLGWVHVPSAPTEAAIALSLLMVGRELLIHNPDSLIMQKPWLAAGLFGLVHGLGFAGALSEHGLPPGDIPVALLLFNLGVETGQVFFVLLILILARAAWVQRHRLQLRNRWLPYGMGSLAGMMFISRVLQIV